MHLPPVFELLVAAVAVGLIGALAGTAGYVAFAGRPQMRQIAALVEQLALSRDTTDLVETRHLRDPRLRAGFGELAERLAEAWRLATTDPLTAVHNRQAVLGRLEVELDRSARYHRPLSVVLIDLDHFKRLNDSHGHAAGDVMLHEVAQILAANIRGVDVLGRYGGEEFMIVLPETDPDAAASIAEKLRRLVGSRNLKLDDGHRLQMTFSAGIAGGAGQHLRLETLVRDADAALYSAKALGRNQVYVFRDVGDDGPVRRSPIAPARRQEAVEVGRAAFGAATDTLTAALNARSGWTGKPSAMIAEAAVAVGRTLGLPDGEIERIRVASLLHDLGKIAIPEEILSKPGELDEPEWRVVAEHPKIGQVVLEQAGALRDAATIVLHHHEWFDGRGYPYGLAGQEIPLGARIVAIADAYEAMVSGRPYRAAVSHEEAIRELERHAGLQFDPEIVRIFGLLFGDGMPWPASLDHGREDSHPHPHPHDLADAGVGVADRRPHGVIHDQLHERRRAVVEAGRAHASRPAGASDDPGLLLTGTAS